MKLNIGHFNVKKYKTNWDNWLTILWCTQMRAHVEKVDILRCTLSNESYYDHLLAYGHISGSWVNVGDDIYGESSYDQSLNYVSVFIYGKTVAVGYQ